METKPNDQWTQCPFLANSTPPLDVGHGGGVQVLLDVMERVLGNISDPHIVVLPDLLRRLAEASRKFGNIDVEFQNQQMKLTN